MPLATLVSATLPPAKKEDVILSPDGFKRYFVTHGGLFGKDGITLDDIRAIKRIGRQPGTEGLMCTLSFILQLLAIRLTCIDRRGPCFCLFMLKLEMLSIGAATLDGPTGIARMGA